MKNYFYIIKFNKLNHFILQKTMLKNKRRIFSQLEDQIIREYVNEHGENWDEVAKKLSGRTPKQCHDRYSNYLREGLKTGPWSMEEDEILIKMHYEIGPKWIKMMKYLPGRSGNDIKNRWHKHLIKREKFFLNQQPNFDQNHFFNYTPLYNNQTNMNVLPQSFRSFLVEPKIHQMNNQANTKIPEDNSNKISNPPPICDKSSADMPSSNSSASKVIQYLAVPPIDINLFNAIDNTEKYMEELFDDFIATQSVESDWEQFYSYI